MTKWTQWFDSPSERRAYIKAQRKEAKKEGKRLRVHRYYTIQRCTKKVTYYADCSTK